MPVAPFRLMSCMLLVGALLFDDAHAQTSSSCPNILPTVRSEYLDGRYQAVVDAVSACLQRGEIDPANQSEAYRLLALSYLKLDDLSAARAAVLQHLSKYPEYEADPINDLPSYRALVELVRDQLGLERPTAPLAAADEPNDQAMQVELAPISPLHGFLASATLGVSSYGGERGVNSESWLGEFGRNAGPLMGVRAEYTLTSTFLLGIGYTVAEYPHVITNKQFNEPHEDIEEGSSKWVHFVTAGLRSRFRGTDWLYPYVTGGLVTSYHFMNDSFSAGVGPVLAVGADFFIDPTMVLFLESEAMMIFPGAALDLADHYGSFDPLTTFSAGARFRISGLGR